MTPESLFELAEARTARTDPAHDFLHVKRVWRWAKRLAIAEGADVAVVEASALLHELVQLSKADPRSKFAGRLAGDEARKVLTGETPEFIDAVADAIASHPYSLGERPRALEGCILQDADRLDGLGAVGIARCFSTGAVMGASFYNEADPFCRARKPDDKAFSVDHFYRKLLRLPATMHTAAARVEAELRVKRMETFLSDLEREIG